MIKSLHKYRRLTIWLALLAILSFLPAIVVGAAPTEQAKLVASDGVFNDFFGHSVSVSGDTAVVGARLVDPGNNRGLAYVYLLGADADGHQHHGDHHTR